MMRNSLMVSVFGAAVFLGGCATGSAPTATYNALGVQERDDDQSSRAKTALEEDFQRALAACDTQMGSLREAFSGSGRRELTLASVGILAGSIIVPTLAAQGGAAKSAIAGWGGLSGATNAAQYTLQQKGLSASRQAAAYESLRKEIQTAASDYAKATRNADRANAVSRLSIACRFPPLPSAEAPKGS